MPFKDAFGKHGFNDVLFSSVAGAVEAMLQGLYDVASAQYGL